MTRLDSQVNALLRQPTPACQSYGEGKVDRVDHALEQEFLSGLLFNSHGTRAADGELYSPDADPMSLEVCVSRFDDRVRTSRVHSERGETPLRRWCSDATPLREVVAKLGPDGGQRCSGANIHRMRRSRSGPARSQRMPVVVVSVGVLLVAACSGAPTPGRAQSPDPSAASSGLSVGAVLYPAGLDAAGRSYSPLAPVSASIRLLVTHNDDGTRLDLQADGLQPDRGYTAHAHVRPCGPTPDAAGPRFQKRVDPAATADTPSTNPIYANSTNEIWMDLRTNAEGATTSSAQVPWVFTDRAPASLVINEGPTTATGPGVAGTSGERLACVDLG